ncbi:monooxygenase [Mycena galericulata]|nr:monooxygenase [Mycena galericulata]
MSSTTTKHEKANDEVDGQYKRLNIGGSLGGLTVGVALKQAGHNTTILERSPNAILQNQGAGIVAGNDTLKYFEKYDRSQRTLKCPSRKRLYFDLRGDVAHEVEMRQNMTSWDLAYYVLRANYDGLSSAYCAGVVPEPTDGKVEYRYGSTVTTLEDEGENKGVRVRYKHRPEGSTQEATDETLTADVVIACDGPNSTVRALFHPEVRRTLAGYCALRGTVPETDVSEAARTAFVERFTFYHGPGTHGGGTQILAYLIPGTNGAVEPGRRLVNFVWYMNFPLESEEFANLMTDVDGKRHRVTLPPGKMRAEVWEKQVAWARDHLPPQFYDVVSRTKKPFAQAVSDVLSPRGDFMDGKVLLIGDALAGFRPHTVMSTSQAAFDAMLVDDYLRSRISLREFRIQTMQYARYIHARGVRMGTRSQFGEDGKLVPLQGHIEDRDIASTPREEEVFPDWTREGIV